MTTEMPQWRSHKVVRADKIVEIKTDLGSPDDVLSSPGDLVQSEDRQQRGRTPHRR